MEITNEFTKEQEAWLVELETTEKLQGTGYLKSENKDKGLCYCCLGIACELITPINNKFVGHYSTHYSTQGFNAALPVGITDIYKLYDGLGDRFDSSEDDVESMSLSVLNDEHKLTFKEIAKTLRDNPHHYFKNFSND